MKLILPDPLPAHTIAPLSELEARLHDPDVAVSTAALEQALGQVATLEQRLRRVSEIGVYPADYPALKALLDACQAAREVLTNKALPP